MQPQNSPERNLAQGLLPWVLAAAALVVYLLSLNHWLGLDVNGAAPMSSNSLEITARVAGWLWQPDLLQPLFWLITYPLRLLPSHLIPLALNVFAAVCAALTLAQLARSVALLPHDRTEEQRARQRHPLGLLSIPFSWAPPALAVTICALQLSFWENATLASAEMLNLLLFAFIIRALLEYRLDGRQLWLSLAAVAYGAGMANNWAMIAFFPIFLVALIWLRGLAFFNTQFLLRMFGWGSAGLLLYLLLPLVAASNSIVEISFWQALKYNLGIQKMLLLQVAWNKGALFSAQNPLWILAVPSLLPLLLMGIRWPSYFGDPSRLGVLLTTLIFHLFHAFLLLVCLWTSLNPQFSPRNLLPGMPGLTLYYLNALAIGYLFGYFLLVFGRKLNKSRTALTYPGFVSTLTKGLFCVLALGTVAGLLYRNLPVIKLRNGPMVQDFAAAMTRELPQKPAIILSDDPLRLMMVHAQVANTGREKDYLFVHTASLSYAEYHRYLQTQLASWPFDKKNGVPPPGPNGSVADDYKIRLLLSFGSTNELYYLHPSFGYYFEAFNPEPHGLVQKLIPASSNLIIELPAQVLAANQEFWTARQDALKPLVAASAPPKRTRELRGVERIFATMHLSPEPSRDAMRLASEYSRALNNWAVQEQRHGLTKEAGAHFRKALALNPDNVIVEVNLEGNRKLQTGAAADLQMPKAISDRFARYRDWNGLMNDNGPFDEVNFCYAQAQEFLRNKLVRQAGELFSRVIELAPNHAGSRLWLAQINIMMGAPDQAIKLLQDLRANAARYDLSSTNDQQLMLVEATAQLAKNDIGQAEKTIVDSLNQHPGDVSYVDAGIGLFLNNGLYTNALTFIERKLQSAENDRGALVNKGFALLQLKDYGRAIPPLTQVINMETNSPAEAKLHWIARMNRAIACLEAEKLDEAKEDYEALQKTFPNDFPVYYGLGEIAYRRQDTHSAIRNFNLYLASAPTNTLEASNVMVKLQKLERSSR